MTLALPPPPVAHCSVFSSADKDRILVLVVRRGRAGRGKGLGGNGRAIFEPGKRSVLTSRSHRALRVGVPFDFFHFRLSAIWPLSHWLFAVLTFCFWLFPFWLSVIWPLSLWLFAVLTFSFWLFSFSSFCHLTFIFLTFCGFDFFLLTFCIFDFFFICPTEGLLYCLLKGLTQLWKSRRIYPKYMPKCSVGSTDHVCKFLLKNFA